MKWLSDLEDRNKDATHYCNNPNHSTLERQDIERLTKALRIAIEGLSVAHNQYVNCEYCMKRENILNKALEQIEMLGSEGEKK